MKQLGTFTNFILGSLLNIFLNSGVFIFILLFLNLFDIITGVLNAIHKKQPIDKDYCFRGILHKINQLFYVITSIFIDFYILELTGFNSFILGGVTSLLIMGEFISICKNISNGDLTKVPKPIKIFLDKFKEVEEK